jgi:hypothetical protein
MGFNLFLYAFIIFGILVGKSYDYEPRKDDETNERETTV